MNGTQKIGDRDAKAKERFQVLGYEEVLKLDQLLDNEVAIHGRGKYPTLEIKLRELIGKVRARLRRDGLEVRYVKLNGGAASHIIGSNTFAFNDLDLIFGVDLSTSNNILKVKAAVLDSLIEFLPRHKASASIQSNSAFKDAYVQKLVRVSNGGDQWSLISLSNNKGRNVELKFVDKMKRQFEFSVDSFQINLESMLLFYDHASMPMDEHFYPTVIGEALYGNFVEASYHLEKCLIATKKPEEIRGGGLLKYCNLLVRDFKPADLGTISTLERYMCSRFFIDFPDVIQQHKKIDRYLVNHFVGDERNKYDFLMTLAHVIDASTVCLMGHERRQTLNLIGQMSSQVLQEQCVAEIDAGTALLAEVAETVYPTPSNPPSKKKTQVSEPEVKPQEGEAHFTSSSVFPANPSDCETFSGISLPSMTRPPPNYPHPPAISSNQGGKYDRPKVATSESHHPQPSRHQLHLPLDQVGPSTSTPYVSEVGVDSSVTASPCCTPSSGFYTPNSPMSPSNGCSAGSGMSCCSSSSSSSSGISGCSGPSINLPPWNPHQQITVVDLTQAPPSLHPPPAPSSPFSASSICTNASSSCISSSPPSPSNSSNGFLQTSYPDLCYHGGFPCGGGASVTNPHLPPSHASGVSTCCPPCCYYSCNVSCSCGHASSYAVDASHPLVSMCPPPPYPPQPHPQTRDDFVPTFEDQSMEMTSPPEHASAQHAHTHAHAHAASDHRNHTQLAAGNVFYADLTGYSQYYIIPGFNGEGFQIPQDVALHLQPMQEVTPPVSHSNLTRTTTCCASMQTQAMLINPKVDATPAEVTQVTPLCPGQPCCHHQVMAVDHNANQPTLICS